KLAREFLDEQSALVSTLIFALHPIHIESVAWISGVTDPLLALFTLLCLLCFIRFRKEQEYGFLILSLVFCAAALLSKETAIIIPALLAAYEYLYGGKEPADASARSARRAFVLLPFVMLAVAMASRDIGCWAHSRRS
ncbi:MAG TPA: glycosyltransferase family 39 protein, partial [Ktedonobacteraceae bacterium]|nr:glycosyltransferase family 39 protein [Ktedonobacteraceae bacterium]